MIKTENIFGEYFLFLHFIANQLAILFWFFGGEI